MLVIAAFDEIKFAVLHLALPLYSEYFYFNDDEIGYLFLVPSKKICF